MRLLALLFLAAPAALAADDVRALWNAQNCVKCHGEDGKGQTAMGRKTKSPDFTKERWQKRHSDEVLVKAIENGAKFKDGRPRMPAYKAKLTHEQIVALVAHVRSFAGGAKAAEKHPQGDQKPADAAAEPPRQEAPPAAGDVAQDKKPEAPAPKADQTSPAPKTEEKPAD